MNLGLENRICLVSGASAGIGRGVVKTLAQEGAQTIAVALATVFLASRPRLLAHHVCWPILLSLWSSPTSVGTARMRISISRHFSPKRSR